MSAAGPGRVEPPAWAAIALAGDWVRWPGLPAGLAEPDLLAALDRAAGRVVRTPGRLGSRQADVIGCEGLQAWLRGGTVILVELEDPAGGRDPDRLLESLGPADRTGHGRYLRYGAMTTEHVYAARGLSLTVAESYDDPPTFAPFVAAVLLFAPTDLRTFIVELGGNDRGGPRF